MNNLNNIPAQNNQKIDEYLNRMRDEFHYSVYFCRRCNFRAFGMAVTAHEISLGHTMIKEIPNA